MDRIKALLLGIVLILGSFYAVFDSDFIQKKFVYPFAYQSIVYYYGHEYDIDPYLIASIIKAESKFSPQAYSHKGAVGLMQIMPETGSWVAEQLDYTLYEPAVLAKPEINVWFGVWYLASLRHEFDNNEILVLSAYNGGRGNVRQWMQQYGWTKDFKQVEAIPFQETREYVKKVLRDREHYRNLYGNL